MEELPQSFRYARLVDRYSKYVSSPVLRLKFLNSALGVSRGRTFWEKLPVVGSLPERAIIVVELAKVLPVDQPAPIGLRLVTLMYRVRYAVYAMCVAIALATAVTLVYAASRVVSGLTVSTEAKDISLDVQRAPTGSGPAQTLAAIAGAGVTPDRVWLAEQGDGYDFYSNGARVLTEFETEGITRRFYRFTLDDLAGSDNAGELLSHPVGIVYHISESDLLPFTDRYNSSLNNQSRSLLEYSRAHRLYNYVIDRFGRTYRIVPDELSANHAGNSIWSDGRSVYVNLSSSFVGICFEGRGTEAINESQVYAARVLTAVVRSKYGIDDANCVTHGLVSVNPSNRLMGYHTDWVSEFPFEALGLSNKYEMELTAVSRLGFAYDKAYVAAAGGKWTGLEKADGALGDEAKRNGLTIEQQRRLQARLFERAYSKERALEKQ
ncbi:MAG TPA: peptidoglycan recognition family protein [Blastocatellia bacterium]|nr:peptidoglycan recognition family protein [Blastocatellia bacterium]